MARMARMARDARARLALTLVATGAGVAFGACGATSASPSDAGAPDASTSRSCPAPTGAGTTHSQTITSDETWTAAGSPHHVTADLAIVGATLTLEPCAEVIVAPGRSIVVDGSGDARASLVAHGILSATAHRPITFRAADSERRWGSLRVTSNGFLDLQVVELSDGGSAMATVGGGGTIVAQGGSGAALKELLHVRDVAIRNSGGFGVNLLTFAAFSSTSAGLTISGAGSEPPPGALDTGFPIFVEPPAVHTIPAGTYTGNARDEILVRGGEVVSRDETFYARGVPYRILGGLAFVPTGSLAQGEVLVVVVEAGVTLRFARAGDRPPALDLGSASGGEPEDIRATRLVVDGTIERPVVLTSAEDSPSPGDWIGIRWRGGIDDQRNLMRHVVIEYAGADSELSGFGCGPTDNDAALIFTHWRPFNAFFTESTIRHSAAGGLTLGWASFQDGPDFRPTNVFEDVAGPCEIARWANEFAPRCPGDDDVPDCL